jgi:hypothetical protein
MNYKRLLALTGAVFLLAFLMQPVASAQSQFATLSGTVTDASGAVVSGAKITVKPMGSADVRKTVTNQDGFFSVPTLPAGRYEVVVEMKGFQKWQGKDVTLNGADSRAMNIELRVGAASETVVVEGTVTQLATTDSGEKSALISSQDLQNLSLVGRNATEYLKLLPGAILAPNGALNKPAYDGQVVGINGFAVGSNAGGLSNVNINGQAVDITQDGQHSFDPGAAGAATPVNPNPNMISEVKVLESNFSAENPKGPVVVNTVTKSGGTTFHGEGYFYARNSAVNAEDAFNKQTEGAQGMTPGFLKVPSSYYYPGFNIGGPLYIPKTGFNKSKQKLFFFEGYENYHQTLDGGVNRAFVPTADMLNGDFSALTTYGSKIQHNTVGAVPTDASGRCFGTCLGWQERVNNPFGGVPCTITGGVLSSGCIDPAAQLLLKNYLPAPNADPTVAGFNYVSALSVPQNSWQNVVRGDWNISDNTKVFVIWSRQREVANMPMGLWINSGDWTVPTPSNTIGSNGSDAVTTSFVHVFSPTMTSETRFGYTYINFPTSLKDPAKQNRAALGFPLKGIFGDSNTPAVLSWGSSFPNLGDVGHDYHPTMIAYKGIPSVAENLTKVVRTHTFKAGFYYEHTYNKQDNWGQFMGVFAYGATGWGGGTTGNEYADALMGIGQAGYFEQALPPPTNLAQNIGAFYAQDDWKVTRRLSIQYGMRFEHYAKPYSNPFGLAIFDPSKYDASIPADQNTQTGISWHSLTPGIPVSGANSRFLFYSPRVGAAFDLFGNGKTVIRGGWGKYRAYDSVQSNSYVQPAQTATGSSSWSCGWNDPLCPTWESVDAHALAPPVYGSGLPAGANKGVFVMDPKNDEQPLVSSYSLQIDQVLPWKFRTELSYVGNHSNFLQAYTNYYNAIPLGTMTTQSTMPHLADCYTDGDPTKPNWGNTACQQDFRPFPDYTTINTSITGGKARFDSFQATLHRNVGILVLQANYTFSKALGDGAQLANGGFPGALSVKEAEKWLRGVLPIDRAHALSLAYVITVPNTHAGNSFVRGVTNGWEISGITQVTSGAQLSAQAPSGGLNFNLNQNGTNQSNDYLLGTPDITLYPVITCNPTHGLAKNQFVNPACFSPAPAGSLGNAGLPYMAGPMFWNSDLTLIKNFRFKERQNVQFRFAAFNFLNHSLPSFTTNDNNLKLTCPAADSGLTCATTSPSFGVAQYRFGHRILEFGLKYSF